MRNRYRPWFDPDNSAREKLIMEEWRVSVKIQFGKTWLGLQRRARISPPTGVVEYERPSERSGVERRESKWL